MCFATVFVCFASSLAGNKCASLGRWQLLRTRGLFFFLRSVRVAVCMLVSRLTAQLAADKVGKEGFDLQSGTPLSRPRRTCSSNNCDVCESEANLSIERAESQTRQKDAKEGEKKGEAVSVAVIATQSIAKHLLSGRPSITAIHRLRLLTSCPPPIRDPLNTSPFRIFVHPTQLFN